MTNIYNGELDLNSCKEEFSYSYIYSVSSTAGYVCQRKDRGMDNAGIDLSIEVPGEISACLHPKLDAQVKCTSADCIVDDYIHFKLKVKNYNVLIHPRPIVPQLLIIVLVPSNINEWIKNTSNPYLTEVRASSYWISLKGLPSTTNIDSITINIPLRNRLSSEVLKEIMRQIAEDKKL